MGSQCTELEDLRSSPHIANKDDVNDLVDALDDLVDESRCKFPWCTEIVAGRHFWDSLIGLDDERLDWLVGDHIELWVWYMWHFRQSCDDWSMTAVFANKGIDPTSYSIKFTNAQNVIKQSGVFGDCGVFVCLFLYRLAHGISLDVEDPIQTALAYREKMV
nr:phospholipase-like protein [Tanacetum cinerariifolium]